MHEMRLKLTQFLTHKARVHDDYTDVIIMQERNLIFKVKFCVRLTQMNIFCLHFRVDEINLTLVRCQFTFTLKSVEQ